MAKCVTLSQPLTHLAALHLPAGTAILLRANGSLEALHAQAPWVMGSFGTILLDMLILYQARVYARPAAAGGALQQPLLQ